MNIYLFASVENMWLLAGWTMIHFLWLGTLVALAALVCRWSLRRASANVRYAVALSCLALLVALPVGIATWLYQNLSTMREGVGGGLATMAEQLPVQNRIESPTVDLTGQKPLPKNAISAPVELHQPNVPTVETTSATPVPVAVPADADPLSRAIVALNTGVRYLPWFWLIGTPITFALTATGLIGTRRLNRASRPIVEGPIADALASLAASLKISRRVAVAVCDRIAAPVLIGILRPIILLPPAALTGYTPEEIEMVLLHELAHVRRWDNLVNLLQRFVESLLFFHPAVWFISTWVRREREACCDSLVVTRTDRPHAYAELLVALAAQMPRSVLFHPAASSAMAAGPLRSRIRSILKLDDDPMLVSGKSFLLTIGGLVTAATLAAFYAPTVGHADESEAAGKAPTVAEAHNQASAGPTSDAVARSQTQNNLRKLILSIHNNVSNRGSLPTQAIYDANSKPLLSWRVHVLPFLAEDKLYHEFHLNEPWDSEHNLKLIARMPDVFKNPKIDKPGMTNYLAVVGKECAFSGSPQALRFEDITDGTSKTIALVEANKDLAVEWTKPQDWEFDRADPTKGLGKMWPGRWYAAWVDGSVRSINNSEPADRVGIQFTRAGGEPDSGTLKDSANRAPTEGAVSNEAAAGLWADPVSESMPLVFELQRAESGQTAILLNGKPISEDEVRAMFRRKDKSPGDQAVSLHAGNGNGYADAIKFIDLLESLGVKKLSFDTRSVEVGGEQISRAPVGKNTDAFVGTPALTTRDAETELLVREIAGLQQKKLELETLLLNEQSDFEAMQGRVESPTLDESQKPAVHAKEQRRADGFKTRIAVLKQNLSTTEHSLDEHLKALRERNEKSVVVENYAVTRNAASLPATTSDKVAAPETIATFPLNWREDGQTDYSPVFDQGIAKNLRMEFIERGDKLLLVGRPQTEKDWPAFLGESPRKERVIAEKAWQRLGLKVVPITPIETKDYRRDRQRSLGVVIVGGNVPKGLPIPSILTKLNGDAIEDMDFLLAWLESKSSKSTEPVACSAIADEKSYLFYASSPASEPATASVEHVADQSWATATRSRFPSLDDQKLADTIWRRLGLELERIDDADMKRVKALGYEGGLKVVGGHGDMMSQDQTINIGDILVGLHVWPTTSLADLAKVLQRPDVAELNPLKFYVVRAASGFGGSPGDAVSTGRILVRVIDNGTGMGGPNQPVPKSPFETEKDPNNPYAVKPRPPVRERGPNRSTASPLEPQPASANIPQGNDWVAVSPIDPEPTSERPARDRTKPMPAPNPYIPRVTIGGQPQTAATGAPLATAPRATATPNTDFSLKPAPPIAPTFPITASPNPYQPGPAITSRGDAVVLTIPNTIVVPNTEQVKVGDRFNVPSVAKTDAQTANKAIPPTPARDVDVRSPDDVILVAYEVPKELVDDVKRRFSRDRIGFRTSWDGRGRFIMQAPRAAHENFKLLLESTPKWRDPAAMKERVAGPITLETKINGQVALEWRAAGITFMSSPSSEHPLPNGPGGVYVTAVVPGSPGHWNEVQPGDVLSEIGNFEAKTIPELESVLKTLQDGYPSNTSLRVNFYRNKQKGDDHRSRSSWQRDGWIQGNIELRPTAEASAKSSLDPIKSYLVSPSAQAAGRTPKLQLYFFYSPQAKPSGEAKVIVERVVKEFADVELVESDTSRNPERAMALGVVSVPDCLLVRGENGEVIRRLTGLQDEKKLRKEINDAISSSSKPAVNSSKNSDATGAVAPSSPKTNLRYDGKTFGDWQNAWRTELSTEKRVDAVKALAAFGANGYGPDAAKAIVEIAGQYDWTSIGGNEAADTLKKACLGAFGYPGSSIVARPIPENDVLLGLLAAVDSKNTNDRLFATWVLPVLAPQNKLAAEALLKLSSDADAKVRFYSFRSMNVYLSGHDNGLSLRVRQELMSNDPKIARTAIKTLVKDAAWFNSRGVSMEKGPALVYVPELFPLLFAPDESVRREARQVLRFASAGDAQQVVEQLLSLLSDDARQSDHVDAIRAIAAMGPKASPALDKLKEKLSTSDAKMRIPAAAAIKMIVGKDQYQKPVADVLGEELGIRVARTGDGSWGAVPRDDKVDASVFTKFTEDVIKEQELLFPPDDNKSSK